MKLFSRLSRSINARRNIKSSKSGDDNRTESDTWSVSVRSARSKRVAKKSTEKNGAQDEEDLNRVQISHNFMDICARHDSDELLAMFASPNSQVHLEDGFSMDAETFCGALKHMWDAFPDHVFRFESIHEEKGTAILEGLVSSATHTGVPYSIGDKYPAIPAAGKRVVNDEERFVFEFAADGSLTDMTVVSFGNVTGPAGFYEQVGGKL